MSDRTYVLSYDIGTTGVKTCLFEVEDEIKLIAAEMEGYSLTVYPDGGAEQDPACEKLSQEASLRADYMF